MVQISKEEIIEYLNKKEFAKLKTAISNWLVQDIAELMSELDDSSAILLFRTLPKDQQADTFSYLELDEQEKLLKKFTNKEATFVLSDMFSDDRAALFEELPGIITRKLFKLLSVEDLKETRLLLGYPEESVGRMMTPDYVSIYKDMTVKEALERIRRKGKDSETLNIIYVIDSNKTLLNAIKLRKIILSEPDTKIEDLMSDSVVSLSAYDDRENAVKLMQKYDVVALPVIGSDGIIIGIVTIDDILDVAEEEATEDIQKISSVSPLKTSYKSASIFTLYSKRIFWLGLLVLISLISSGILSHYETVLNSAIILAVFIPLLVGSGGNMGSQSATLMIRALATEDVKMNEWFKVFIKEIFVGLMIGSTLGILSSIVGFFRGGAVIGLILGLTMISITLVANLIGVSLPFLLSKLKIDPAVSSSPLITTIMDALGLIIYFRIAILIL